MGQWCTVDNREYWAFISYRHADNKIAGRQWATWLHQVLETYEIPEDLVGTINNRGEEIPARIFPVFRDEEELPVDADLASPIYRALDNSKHLIVICSPRAVQSPYVAAEISYFKKIGRSDKVLALMIDGEPNTSLDEGKQKLGFKPEDECFPLPLQYDVDEDGNLTENRSEPIAADLRIVDEDTGTPSEGWTSIEAYKQYLKLKGKLSSKEIDEHVIKYQKQLDLMKLKIVAGALGVPLGTLTERDKAYLLEKQQRRARIFRRVAVVMSMLLVVAVAAGIFAFLQRNEAIKQKDEVEKQKEIAERNANEANLQRGLAESNLIEAKNQKEIARREL